MTGVADTLLSTGGTVDGRVQVPGDKSISHRAAFIAAMAAGESTLHGFLFADDCLATLDVLVACGIDVRADRDAECVVVSGGGNHGLKSPGGPLDFRNSGTGMRLAAGILAGRGITATLTGDASLRSRPMKRIVDPLVEMGAAISATGGCAPLDIRPSPLRGTQLEIAVASAQVKSCLLFAGLHASGQTRVVSPASRDHTEFLLAHYGVPVEADGDALTVARCDWDRIAGREVHVPGDASAAAFLAVAAAIAPGGAVELPGVGMNPGRTGYLDVLRRMGAIIKISSVTVQQGEPVADLLVQAGELRGVDILPHEIPALIDELPALLVAAACAEGETTVRGAAELRVKESDRLAAMSAVLRGLGAEVEEFPDGLRVRGCAKLDPASVDALGDHRVAMAALIAGIRARGAVSVRGCSGIATSYPGFVDAVRSVGLEVAAA